MNLLAQELNTILSGSIADHLFSDFGRRLYFPKGIVAQTAEAKQYAKKFNATVGMAFYQKEPIFLQKIQENFPKLTPRETVAYAPTPGDPELRKKWKEEIVRKNPAVDPDSISLPMVVSGLTNGIAHTADLFIDPEDTVIVPDMFWGNYRLIFEVRKSAKIVEFPFFTKNRGFNTEAMKEAILQNSRKGKVLVMLNFPNNPTGYSPTQKEAELCAQTLKECADKGIHICAVCDDAYFGLFYEEETYKHSLFSLLYNLHENILAVKIDGATKEDYVWGFRIGFVAFGNPAMTGEQYEALNKKLMGSIRSSISSSSRPAQSLLKNALKSPDYQKDKERYSSILRERYKKVLKALEAYSESRVLVPFPFNSGYFMCFKAEGISTEKLRTVLLKEKGIGTISIQDKYLRVAFSSVEDEDIQELYSDIYETADIIIRLSKADR